MQHLVGSLVPLPTTRLCSGLTLESFGAALVFPGAEFSTENVVPRPNALAGWRCPPHQQKRPYQRVPHIITSFLASLWRVLGAIAHSMARRDG